MMNYRRMSSLDKLIIRVEKSPMAVNLSTKESWACGRPAPDPNMGVQTTSTDLISSSCQKKRHIATGHPKSLMPQPDRKTSIWQSRLHPRSKPKGQVERGRPV